MVSSRRMPSSETDLRKDTNMNSEQEVEKLERMTKASLSEETPLMKAFSSRGCEAKKNSFVGGKENRKNGDVIANVGFDRMFFDSQFSDKYTNFSWGDSKVVDFTGPDGSGKNCFAVLGCLSSDKKGKIVAIVPVEELNPLLIRVKNGEIINGVYFNREGNYYTIFPKAIHSLNVVWGSSIDEATEKFLKQRDVK